ncbi:hypothetical protein FY180_04280 [Anaplasma marginale]|nr:hypothetical protein FY180_04280 [Anaplasma marginale]
MVEVGRQALEVIAEQVRKELRAELKAIDAVTARESLREELDAIDAEWAPKIELSKELKAIDAEMQHAITFWHIYRAIIGSIELRKELDAIDAETQHAITFWRISRAIIGSIELRKELKAIGGRWELRKELDDIDAEMQHAIKLRSALRAIEGRIELSKELKAIDAEWQHAITFWHISRAIIGSIELRKELKAIDAEWAPRIEQALKERVAKAQKDLADAAKVLDQAAQKLSSFGLMSTTSTPGTDLIGVVATAVATLTAAMQQQHVPAAPGTELAEPAITTLAAAGMQPAPSTALTGVAAEVATPSTALGV